MEWLKSTKLIAFASGSLLSFAGLMTGKMSGSEFQLAITAITLAYIAGKFGESKYKAGE